MIENRLETLYARLRSAPVEVVQGVVHPAGVGAGRLAGDTWQMTFSLAAWARAEGPISRTKLVVRRKILERELARYRDLLPPDGVVSLEVGLREDGDGEGLTGPQACLHAVRNDPPRPDLVQLAAELQRPRTTPDAQFGVFTHDRTLNWHQAETVWSGQKVQLSLSSDEDRNDFPQAALAVARELWREQAHWNESLRTAIVRELLPLKNESWLGDDEEPVSEERFWSGLTPESITVYEDGTFEFWFDDGGAFWGHGIMATGSREKGITDAGIHG